MFFTSYEFIGFLAVVFLLYYVLPKKMQWPLLVASYVFYFIASPVYVIFIFVTTITTFFAAQIIQRKKDAASSYLAEHKKEMDREQRKAYKADAKKIQKRYFLACLLFSVLP